jgi:hypothetical protein
MQREKRLLLQVFFGPDDTPATRGGGFGEARGGL